MKKALLFQLTIVLSVTILLFAGCFKDEPEDYYNSYNCSGTTCLGLTDYSGTYSTKTSCENSCATGTSNCDFTEWTGSGNCNSGYVSVYTNTCCPSSSPYHNTATNNCFTSCEAAKNANSFGKIYKGNSRGSSGGSGSCIFVAEPAYHKIGVDYKAVCSGGYLHVKDYKCCPSSSKWYCSKTDKCYQTKCDVYKACNNGKSSIYVGHTH